MEVIIDGVRYVPASKEPFPVGSFVEAKAGGKWAGEVGEVAAHCVERVGVKFPNYKIERHNLGGSVATGHGWWYDPDQLLLCK